MQLTPDVALGDVLIPKLLGLDALKRFLPVGFLRCSPVDRFGIDELAKARFERRLGEPPVNVARFGRDAALFIHEHKPVCAYLECEASAIP